MKHLAMPAGFKAELFVSEPQIGKPITMTWDHKGRLYVAETVDYPNEIQPKGKGRDRISIVEDTDGDGKADKFTVFAENLSIPTSLCYANGGLIVAQAPDMLFLKDTDGDGKADERKVLFTGFSTHDTHAGPSNLRYGLDNWIYAIIGYAGFAGDVGGERHQLPPGVLPVQAGRVEAGIPPRHEQQLVGRRHQRGGLPVRLDGQRLPERLHADREPLLRIGARDVADRAGRTSPTRTASSRSPRTSARSTGTAGSRPERARRSTRPAPIRRNTGTGPRSSPSRPATSSRRSRCIPDGTDFHAHNAWNLVASDDEWTSPIWPRSAPTATSG